MDMVILLIRAAIWLTFLLLIVGEITGIILARHAIKMYLVKHRELEIRVEAAERRIALLEKGS